MEKPTEKYLQELIDDARKKFDDFSYGFDDLKDVETTYVCTKKRNLTGILSGFCGLAEMKTLGVKESSKIRSSCKNYNKFYRSGGKVRKIECFACGHNSIDVIYIALYDGGRRYLFPYFDDYNKAVGYPIVVTKYENGNVVEEYRVDGNKILYEKYDYSLKDSVRYYCINFVPTGQYPILGEEEGYFAVNSLEYRQTKNKVWCQKQ